MPTLTAPDLGRAYPPEVIPKFPAMGPGDTEVWRRALPTLQHRYTAIYYNVRLGAYTPDFGTLEPAYQKSALDSTAYRIDVVADRGDSYDMIEVKDRSSVSAIGQLLTYATLWNLNPPNIKPINLVYVAPQLTYAVSLVLAKYNIQPVIA